MPDQNLLSSRAIRGMYYARLNVTSSAWLNGVANLFTSDQPSETYAFLGQTPAMREWIGKRQAKSLRENSFTIPNVHYEGTIQFALRDLRRDKTGQIQMRINEFADQGVNHWSQLCSSLLKNAASAVCYDGKYFFATDHQEGDSGVQSNKINVDISTLPAVVHGTTTAPSAEEMQWALIQAIAQIMAFKDDQGQPMNEEAKIFNVVLPFGLWIPGQAAISRLNTQYLAPNMDPNLIDGITISAKLDARSTWTDTFAVFQTDAPAKAFIRQQETELMLKVKAEGSEFEFDNDAWEFGIDAWRGADYGLWQRACQVTLT